MKKIIFIFGLLAGIAAGCQTSIAAELHYPKGDAQDVELKGDAINDTVFAFGDEVIINVPISGDLFVAARNVEINAPVGGNLFLGASTAVIAGDIKQDAFVGTSALTFSDAAKVTKNLYYAGPMNDKLASHVTGSVVMPPQDLTETKENNAMEVARRAIMGGLTLLFTGAVLIRLLPKTVSDMASNIIPHWGKNFLAGVITLIVTPIVAMFLCVSTIGMPLGLVFFALWFWELYVAVVIGAHAIGQHLLKKQQNPFIQYAAGVTTLTILTAIPGTSFIITTLLIVFGLGAIVLTKYALYQKLRSQL